jgi:excisionase family DNA binding protein
MKADTEKVVNVWATETGKRLTLLLRGVEVAEILGISRALAYRWMASGVLPTVRVPGSRSIRVPRDGLLEWIRQNTQAGIATAA